MTMHQDESADIAKPCGHISAFGHLNKSDGAKLRPGKFRSGWHWNAAF